MGRTPGKRGINIRTERSYHIKSVLSADDLGGAPSHPSTFIYCDHYNMAKTTALVILASLCVGTFGHYYGQPRVSRPGYYAADLPSLDPSQGGHDHENPHDMTQATPPSVPAGDNRQPPQATGPQEPSRPQAPRMESGFQPSSGDAIQRGTQKFADGVRQGIVHGLEEFLGVQGGAPPSPGQPAQANKPTTGSSVTYANPSALSYNAPGPFIYGAPALGSRVPQRQTTNYGGYQQPAQAAYQQGPPRRNPSNPSPNSGSGFDRYTTQSLGSGANPNGNNVQTQPGRYVAQGTSALRGPGQPPAVTHWFRQDHSGQGLSSLGRNAPADYQQPGVAASLPVPQYVNPSHQHPIYTYQ